jgi:outer membrane protein assembly factor BamB
MRVFTYLTPIIIIALMGHGGTLNGSDWPMYRGVAGDGIATETAPLPWSGGNPKVLWKAPTNTGFSSFAVGGGRVFTQVVRVVGSAPREICVALDAATGKELWFADVDVGKGYTGGGDGDGPRSTPTLNDGLVYVFTPNLLLHCLDAASGKTVWRHDLIKDFGGKNITWKSAASPVVEGNLVLAASGGAGQSFLAFNKKTGALAWKTGTETLTYSTPTVATILGQRQVIFFTESGLVALSLEGRPLWKFPLPFIKGVKAISPVVSGDLVFCSTGSFGGGVCRISKTGNGFSATKLWFKKDTAIHWSTPVVHDGYLYGMFGYIQYGDKGPMKCVELATGIVMWKKLGFGQGNCILVGDKLLALGYEGSLVAIEPSPKAYQEIARTKVLGGKCWSTPAYSDKRVYIRSTTDGACLDLSGK